jgi:poly(ADP-ribose) glycohydrolase
VLLTKKDSTILCDFQELVPHWTVVKEALSKDITNTTELVEAIQECGQNNLNCGLLEALLDEASPFEGRYCELEIEHFFDKLLPGIKKLALQLPDLVTKPIPYLKGGQSISLTNMQVASILANAFFCTFPPRNRTSHSLPDINFKGYDTSIIALLNKILIIFLF